MLILWLSHLRLLQMVRIAENSAVGGGEIRTREAKSLHREPCVVVFGK